MIYANNPGYHFQRGSILDGEIVRRCLEGVDYVVHLAAVVGEPASNKFPDLTYAVNYEGSVKLIEAARDVGVKGFIFASTCSNYGIAKGMATEETEVKPLSLYAETKVNVERHLSGLTDLDWVVCRLATVYGSSPRMRFDLTVNDFTMQALTRKRLEVFLPHTRRPYVHVFDVARSIAEILHRFDVAKRNVFNVGFSRENYEKLEIVQMIKESLPTVEIQISESGTDFRDYQVDFSKFERVMALSNTYSVRDGIKEIIAVLRSGIIADPENGVYYNASLNL